MTLNPFYRWFRKGRDKAIGAIMDSLGRLSEVDKLGTINWIIRIAQREGVIWNLNIKRSLTDVPLFKQLVIILARDKELWRVLRQLRDEQIESIMYILKHGVE